MSTYNQEQRDTLKDTVCEGQTSTISCPVDSKIIIKHALYGRTDRVTCPHQFMSDIYCKAPNARHTISQR